jgi:hypothetical protein
MIIAFFASGKYAVYSLAQHRDECIRVLHQTDCDRGE